MSAFNKPQWEWAKKARYLLAEYRAQGPFMEQGVYVSEERADRLEQEIAEALFKAYTLGCEQTTTALRLEGYDGAASPVAATND